MKTRSERPLVRPAWVAAAVIVPMLLGCRGGELENRAGTRRAATSARGASQPRPRASDPAGENPSATAARAGEGPVLPAPPAASAAPEPTSRDERVEAAVVKIELFEGKRAMSFGTGFFVSADGLLVTNYHVFSDVLERRHKPVFYLGRDKANTLTDFEIVRCMDDREIDLCVLRLRHAPRSFLSPRREGARPGEPMFTIGNPKTGDFSRAEGTVARTFGDVRELVKINDYTRNRSVELIRLNAPLTKGFSGGPVVDSSGQLLGVNSVILLPPKESGEKFVLAISAAEVTRYLGLKSPFDLESFTKRQIANNPILHTPAEKLSEAQIDKACSTAQKNECLAGIKAACADPKRKLECERVRAHFKSVVEGE